MANRRLDWLVYTIFKRIVPYYTRNYARNTRDQDECDMQEYAHHVLDEEELAGPSTTARAHPPIPLAPRAPRSEVSHARAEETLDKLMERMRTAVDVAKAEGRGAAALSAAITFVRRAAIKVEMAGLSLVANPLVANGGDNSTKRKEPAALGGAGKRRRTAGSVPVVKLVPNAASGRARKPKALRKQLAAMPGAAAAGQAAG